MREFIAIYCGVAIISCFASTSYAITFCERDQGRWAVKCAAVSMLWLIAIPIIGLWLIWQDRGER